MNLPWLNWGHCKNENKNYPASWSKFLVSSDPQLYITPPLGSQSMLPPTNSRNHTCLLNFFHFFIYTLLPALFPCIQSLRSSPQLVTNSNIRLSCVNKSTCILYKNDSIITVSNSCLLYTFTCSELLREGLEYVVVFYSQSGTWQLLMRRCCSCVQTSCSFLL